MTIIVSTMFIVAIAMIFVMTSEMSHSNFAFASAKANGDRAVKNQNAMLPSFSSSITNETKPKEYLISKLIPKGPSVTDFSGKRGDGVGFVAQQMAFAVSIGIGFCKGYVKRAGKVVYICLKDYSPNNVLFRGWCDAYGVRYETVNDNYTALTADRMESMQYIFSGIRRELDFRPDLIIINTIGLFSDFDYRNQSKVSYFYSEVNELASRYSCAILVVRNSSGEKSVFTDSADSVLFLGKFLNTDLYLVQRKNRFEEPARTLRLKIGENGDDFFDEVFNDPGLDFSSVEGDYLPLDYSQGWASTPPSESLDHDERAISLRGE